MKNLLIILLTLFACQSAYAAKALDIALEMESLKAEYISSSNRGLIYVYGCSQCGNNKFYPFNSKPVIKRGGQEISFEEFLKDYPNAKEPTVFLDPNTSNVQRINY